MKKLMILAVAFLAIGATSCKKCKDCKSVTPDGNGGNITIDLGEQCDDDLEAAEATPYVTCE